MATVTLLQLKSDFFRYMNQQWSSTATGGNANSIADNTITNNVSELWPYPFQDAQVRVTSGTASGDLRQVSRLDEIHGSIYVSRPFTSTGVTNGDTYELWGNGIHGGQRLTDLFNDTMLRLRPPTQDQITIVTNQRIYDITSFVQYVDDVIEVWLRLIDPANLIPYTPIKMQWWDVYPLGGASASGSSQVILEIRPALTNQTTVQMWLEHYQTMPVFSSDSSTIDAIYRPWLVWEAVLTFCERMMENVSTDRKVWEVRRQRAISNLRTLRQRYIPLRPIRIKPEIPM
jgi:hypothetical protein